MKQRYVREGDTLADDDAVVVRGGQLTAELLSADAARYHDAYGTYGISVFAVRDITFDELAQQSPLVRFEHLTLITAGVLRGAGLRLEPTGRNPRHCTVAFDDLDEGVSRLYACEHQLRVNPYYEE